MMRIELAMLLQSRDGTILQDSGMVNAYAEKNNQQICYKRGGVDEYLNLQGYGSTPWTAQGIFQYNGDLYSVVDDILIKNASTSYAT